MVAAECESCLEESVMPSRLLARLALSSAWAMRVVLGYVVARVGDSGRR